MIKNQFHDKGGLLCVSLLVEDNKALCEATALALRNEGWSVDTVHRGDEARFYLAEGGYDAILLDRMLPGCDGIQLVREMRQQKR